ncbi:MAG TPA: hypothetical protein VE868_06320 [Balneolaceae bacterium]|nr:hypothetical protein [Balneolaceae bacterium]
MNTYKIINKVVFSNLFRPFRKKNIFYLRYFLLGVLILSGAASIARGQAEVMPWGNLRGIRIDGQLMKFETSLRVVGDSGSTIAQTAKERQTPSYTKNGNKQIIKTRLDSIKMEEVVKSKNMHTARVVLRFTADTTDTSAKGAYFCINLPGSRYSGGMAKLVRPEKRQQSMVSLKPKQPNGKNEYLRTRADGILFVSPDRRLRVTFNEPISVLVKDDRSRNKNIEVYLKVLPGNIQKGNTAKKIFTLKASGKVDRRPIKLRLNTSKPGRTFDGIGGNFRLQNPKLDPEVIKYNLNNLRVAWGRVELPWRSWQPQEKMDPIKAAKSGKLNPKVKAAMKMAQKLSQRGIPLILSVWYPPKWAVKGHLHRHPVNGVWGNALDSSKTNEIYKSITEYIRYLKNHYGVKIKMFSFNESNLGINVRQTPREHDRLIKGLGAYFAAHGLSTKLLLGDTSDANGYNFIIPAMNDPAACKYIGAVDFHSWRGWADSTLAKWAHAAKKINRPLIVGEGSINAAAWHYPQVFLESRYARNEINLYVKILSMCQPESILQWQLTSDYADMAGGGIWGNDSIPLHPTQRFWDLKQLGSTPKGLHFMPIHSNRSNVTAAALGNNKDDIYAIHLVNNGATRKVKLVGLPRSVHRLQIYVTDAHKNMKKRKPVKVKNGDATFILRATSFTSLMNKQ